MDKVLDIFNKKSDESFASYRANIFQKITGESIDSVMEEINKAKLEEEEAKRAAEEEEKRKAEEEEAAMENEENDQKE